MQASDERSRGGALRLRLFGAIGLARNGAALALPASRKARAILAYLALAERPVPRQRLCDLFFDVPDDPRASLRWCLAKIRPVLDGPERTRLVAERDVLRLDLDDVDFDLALLRRFSAEGPRVWNGAAVDEALRQVHGQLFEDGDLPDRPEYEAWLAAARLEASALAISLIQARLDQLIAAPDQQVALLQRWLALDPTNEDAYVRLVQALAALGRQDEAESLVASAQRALSQSGMAPSPALRSAARGQKRLARAAAATGAEPAHNDAAAPPTVAILPFQDLSAQPLPDHVPAGLLDGLTHALSRFRSLCVITPASSARYGGALEDPAAIATALGADILVGGSIMAAPDGRLRLRWRAYAGASNAMLAAGDLEGALHALWDFQEDAAAAIAVEVEPRAQAEALRTRAGSPTTSASAYDLYLQGLFAGFSLERRDAAAALALFQRAIEIDPRFHPALAMAPWAAAYANAIASPEDLARFAQMSRDALRIGRDDARTQATAGTALFYMAHEFDPARAAIDRALTLNPNEYTAWICGGWMHAMKGEAAEAHRMFDQAERLNPLAYGANGLMSGRAMAEFMAGRIAEAERFIVRALSGDDSHPSALMTGMATAAELGLPEPLARRREAFLAIYPAGLDDLAIRALPFEDIRCRRAYFDAVGKAFAADAPPSDPGAG